MYKAHRSSSSSSSSISLPIVRRTGLKTAALQGRSGRRHVRIKVEIDEALLAGFIVEFNYETLDFSVKAAINDAVSRTAEALGVEMAV